MKNIFLVLGIAFFSTAQSQNLRPKREAFVLKVQRNAKQFYAQQVKQTPYFVTDKTLQIYPLEKVNIEVEIKNDTIFSMVSVKENLHPEKTIEIEFCQTVENHEARPAFLYVKNPFPKKLSYNVIAYLIDESEWKQVNKTAKPNWTSLEAWKEVIGSLVLKDWKFEK